jgi:hypothetical protein
MSYTTINTIGQHELAPNLCSNPLDFGWEMYPGVGKQPLAVPHPTEHLSNGHRAVENKRRSGRINTKQARHGRQAHVLPYTLSRKMVKVTNISQHCPPASTHPMVRSSSSESRESDGSTNYIPKEDVRVGAIIYASRIAQYDGPTKYDEDSDCYGVPNNLRPYVFAPKNLANGQDGPLLFQKRRYWVVVERPHARHIVVVPITSRNNQGRDGLGEDVLQETLTIGPGNELTLAEGRFKLDCAASYVMVSEVTKIEKRDKWNIVGFLDEESTEKLHVKRIEMASRR